MKKSIVILLSVVLCACHGGRDYFPRDIEAVEVEIVRFDSAQLAVHPDSVRDGIEQLYTDYEEFMPMFVEGILRLPTEDTVYLCKMYGNFLTDTVMGFAQTNALAQEKFANIDGLQKSINTAFSRLHYLYPEWEIPKVYLFVSGFNSSVMYYENIMGVGVDMYLGSDYPYYSALCALMRSIARASSKGTSGIAIATAPTAIPAIRAICPQSLPITSITLQRA